LNVELKIKILASYKEKASRWLETPAVNFILCKVLIKMFKSVDGKKNNKYTSFSTKTNNVIYWITKKYIYNHLIK